MASQIQHNFWNFEAEQAPDALMFCRLSSQTSVLPRFGDHGLSLEGRIAILSSLSAPFIEIF